MTRVNSTSSVLPAPPQPKPARRAKQDRRCTAELADGRPCPATPLAAEPFCFQHSTSPEIVEKRAVARLLGGLRTQARALAGAGEQVPADLRSREGVALLLERTVNEVRAGHVAPSVANAIKGLTDTALKLVELEMESRLLAIERELQRTR